MCTRTGSGFWCHHLSMQCFIVPPGMCLQPQLKSYSTPPIHSRHSILSWTRTLTLPVVWALRKKVSCFVFWKEMQTKHCHLASLKLSIMVFMQQSFWFCFYSDIRFFEFLPLLWPQLHEMIGRPPSGLGGRAETLQTTDGQAGKLQALWCCQRCVPSPSFIQLRLHIHWDFPECHGFLDEASQIWVLLGPQEPTSQRASFPHQNFSIRRICGQNTALPGRNSLLLAIHSFAQRPCKKWHTCTTHWLSPQEAIQVLHQILTPWNWPGPF